MRTRLRWAVAAAVVVAILIPQWYSLYRMAAHREAALDGTPTEIVIGVSWPFAARGGGLADGLELARADIAAEGGVAGGLPLRLELRDDRDDPDRARAIAREFADTAAMSAVIGYADDRQAAAAAAAFEASGLLQVVVGATGTAITQRDQRYLVRTAASGERLAERLAAAGKPDPIPFALIWEKDSYGEEVAEEYRIARISRGSRVAYEWSYPPERPDFRRPAHELKAAAAELVLFVGKPAAFGDFLRLARRVGLDTPALCACTDAPELRRRAGAALAGAMVIDFYDPAAPRPANRAFVARFRAHYGRDPDTWAAQGYDALRLVARAVAVAGTAKPLDLAYALRYMTAWDGAGGRYAFDGQGELVDKPLYLERFLDAAGRVERTLLSGS